MAKPLPTGEQARVGGALAVENGHNLYESASQAAEVGNFGTAVALTVLAIEDAAKGRALFGYALAQETSAPFALNDSQFRDLIYLRHLVALFQGMSNVMHTAMLTGAVPACGDERAQLVADLRASNWLLTANQRKLHGLYVDFLGADWVHASDHPP